MDPLRPHLPTQTPCFSRQLPKSAHNCPVFQIAVVSRFPPCEKTSPSTYLINFGEIIPGSYELVLSNIKNPASYPASSNLKLRTYFAQTILVDANEYFDAVPLLTTPSAVLGSLSQQPSH